MEYKYRDIRFITTLHKPLLTHRDPDLIGFYYTTYAHLVYDKISKDAIFGIAQSHTYHTIEEWQDKIGDPKAFIFILNSNPIEIISLIEHQRDSFAGRIGISGKFILRNDLGFPEELVIKDDSTIVDYNEYSKKINEWILEPEVVLANIYELNKTL